MRNRIARHLLVASFAIVLAGCASSPVPRSVRADLACSLTFHAPFDGTPDATFARGDRRMQVGPGWSAPRRVSSGLPPGGAVHIAPGSGRHGDALRFDHKITEVVGFKAAGNVAYRKDGWSGTVSFWLRLSPEQDLAPDFCDPIQITSKAWDDASFFTDFDKDGDPRSFRLGAFADKAVWNPAGTAWEKIPDAERPMAKVARHPFRRDRWTHVAFTWDGFNTGRASGVAKLYLDGAQAGETGPRTQTYTWDMDEALVMLGFSYTGWMDDLAVFDRALGTDEVRSLGRLPGGVADLHR